MKKEDLEKILKIYGWKLVRLSGGRNGYTKDKMLILVKPEPSQAEINQVLQLAEIKVIEWRED